MTYFLFLLCEISRLFQQNLLSSHRSEHFTSHQKQQKCLSHSRICLVKYRVTQQLYWNAIEHASSSWKLMKEHTNKTTDKRQDCIRWFYLQNYSQWMNKERHHQVQD